MGREKPFDSMVHPTSEHALASFHRDRNNTDPAWEIVVKLPSSVLDEGVRVRVWGAFNRKGLQSVNYFDDRMYRGFSLLDRTDNNYPE
jgi:hypothetical protein